MPSERPPVCETNPNFVAGTTLVPAASDGSPDALGERVKRRDRVILARHRHLLPETCRWPDLSSLGVSEHAVERTTGAAAVPTVRGRLRDAHLFDERVHDHFEARAIVLDDDVVLDLDQEAPHGSRIVFAGRG